MKKKLLNFFTSSSRLKIFLFLNKEIFLEILYQFLVILKNCIMWYEAIFDIKLLMSWFLVINPFNHTITYAIYVISRPMYLVGRGWWPRFFGYDVTYMYNLYFLKRITVRLNIMIKHLAPAHRVMHKKYLEFLYKLYKS